MKRTLADRRVDEAYAAVQLAGERIADAANDAGLDTLPPSVREAVKAYRAAVSALASALVSRDNQRAKKDPR